MRTISDVVESIMPNQTRITQSRSSDLYIVDVFSVGDEKSNHQAR